VLRRSSFVSAPIRCTASGALVFVHAASTRGLGVFFTGKRFLLAARSSRLHAIRPLPAAAQAALWRDVLVACAGYRAVNDKPLDIDKPSARELLRKLPGL
jgi:hypothetical protein